jgi:hypothetical protein
LKGREEQEIDRACTNSLMKIAPLYFLLKGHLALGTQQCIPGIKERRIKYYNARQTKESSTEVKKRKSWS